MEFKVTEKKDNPLLERTEVKLNASFSGATPSFAKIRTELIKFLKSDKNLTVVDGIKQEFGAHEVSCYAKVYASSQAMTVEPQHRLTKNFEAVEKEKPAEPEDKPPAEASEKEKPAVEDSVIEDVKEPAAEAEVNENSGEEKSGGEEKPAVEESSEVAEDVSSVKKNAKEGEAVEVESAGETQEESKDEDSGVKSAGEE